MKTKTVYLHDNGNLVIWGLSEFFESSHFVIEEFRIEESVADSEDFRAIVQLHNDLVEDKKGMLKDIETLKERNKSITENFYRLNNKFMLIKNLSFWKRLFKKNIVDIIGNEIVLD